MTPSLSRSFRQGWMVARDPELVVKLNAEPMLTQM